MQRMDSMIANCPFLQVRRDILQARRPFLQEGISYTVRCRGCYDREYQHHVRSVGIMHAGMDATLAGCPFIK